jgi:hypothetical protein
MCIDGSGFKNNSPEQALIVKIKLSDDNLGSDGDKKMILDIENRIEHVIEENGLGEFDGDEFGEGFCTMYIYGESVDAILESVDSIFRDSRLPSCSYLIKRYGNPGSYEERIFI